MERVPATIRELSSAATSGSPTVFAAPVAAEPVAARDAATRGVTRRVVLFSLLLACIFGYVIPIVDYKFQDTFLGAAHLPAAAVAVLLLLLLVINPLLHLVSRRLEFSRNETLTVYITCLFSALVPGRGSENFFIPNILASFYFATRDNKWKDFLLPYVKPWFTPAVDAAGHYNQKLVDGWYVGGNQGVPWALWMVPLVAWCAVILAIHIMHGCLGVMLRAQWGEREALAFPLLRLPLELTEHMDRDDGRATSFFRNPVMWIGFGIAVYIELMNGLNLYFPNVPNVPLTIPTGPLLSEAPWNQIGSLEIRVYPAVLGITYLLTSEVSFSLWFVYLFMKVEYLMAYYLGYMPNSMPTPLWTRGWAKGMVGYQQFGSFFAFVGFILWIGREHFVHIVRRAFGQAEATPAELTEPLSYPIAFWGFTAAFSFIVLWTVAAGVRLPVALLLWVTYLVIALGLTRLVAEGGLMFVHTGWMPMGPLAFLFGGGPGKLFDPASVAPASILSGGLMLELRGFLLPSFVQSFKLAHDRKIALRPLVALIFAVTVISFWMSVWVVMRLGYSVGGLQLQKWWIHDGAVQPALHTVGIARGLNEDYWQNWIWFGVGALSTYAMMVARSRLIWFPLHPIGLLMCVPFALSTMWFSIFLGWLCKGLITRFGGTDSYRKTIPLFLGLALGDICMVVFWVAIDAWQGRTGHSLLPF